MRRRWILVVFFLAASVRVYNLNVPFVEPFNSISRLSICGSVARNFYNHGFNFFYPEIDENGPGPYLLNAEMPTYTYLMALAYWLAGGVHEWAARAVSVVFSLAGLWLLYLILRKTGNERIALYGLIFAAISPMNVALARSTQCDTTMVFAGLGAIYLFYRYRETNRPFYFWTSALFMFLAVGTKIYSLYLFIPILYLAWEKDGWALFRKPKNYLYAMFVSLSLIWYLYMWKVDRNLELAYATFCYPPGLLRESGGYLNLFLPPYVNLPAKALLAHMLTPLGAVLFAFGIVKNTFKSHRFVWVWLFSVIFYLLVMWPMAVIHPYYMLSLIPPLAFFVGLGADRLLSSKKGGPILRKPLLIALLVCLEAAAVLYYYRLLYFIPKDRMAIVDAGKAVDLLMPKDSLVIASWGGSPIQLYYCDRKGWAFDLARKDDDALIHDFEKLIAKGADAFVTTKLDELRQLPLFERYLKSRYALVKSGDNFVIYDLTPNKAEAAPNE